MELDLNHFKSLNQDLIVDIMSRLDACTLAATATTCTDLRDSIEDETLWHNICHKTWPSTSTAQIPFHKSGGFKSLYADAFPLILHDVKRGPPKPISSGTAFDASSSSRDFISLIDIYYKKQCIFSKVVDGIIKGIDENRLSCYPFKLDVLRTEGDGQDFPDFYSRDILTNLHEERTSLCNKIVGDLRLSWILFDRRKGKAANISSWRPRAMHKGTSSEEEIIICFGSVVTMDDGLTAECVITAKCKLMLNKGCIRWTQITLVIKDIDGSHLNGEQSMKVMKQALISPRSVNHHVVESGYQQFCKEKIELKLRNEQEESLANLFSATIAIAALLGICYACATLL